MRLWVWSLSSLNGLGIWLCSELWCRSQTWLRSCVAVSCGVGHKHGSDPALLWLWCRPAATALIGPLAWEPPYALSTALEKTKKKKFFFRSIFSNSSPLSYIQRLTARWKTSALGVGEIRIAKRKARMLTDMCKRQRYMMKYFHLDS